MICRYCGTALPQGALFCGECGQPVSSAPTTASSAATVSSIRPVPAAGAAAAASPTAPVTTMDPAAARPAAAGFSIADLAFSSPGTTSDHDHLDEERELPDGTPLDPTPDERAESVARCPQCGEPMAEGDVFCGECGFVVRSVAPPAGLPEGVDASDDGFGADGVPTESDDLVPEVIEFGEFPRDPDAPDAREAVEQEADDSDATTEIEPLLAAELDAAPEPDPAPPLAPEPEPSIDHMVRDVSTPSTPHPVEADPDLDFDEPLPLGAAAGAPTPSPRSRPIPDPFPWGTDRPLREDIEATRLVADPESGIRYVLQFSTGESVTVAGSGLVGRNPSVQPGEYVDQLVPIFDAGKSVSKTHLEFGQESGRFWVSDRYSTNGSVIRQPDAEPRRCDPGRRYFIARGSRVDVGEQFFVVS
ncbi:MAG TPA: zinc-ribbon domain-containing protein [Pseudolysinimonas sp.]|jgi:hypothetical protein